jgi:hypothetical protein
MGTPAAVKDIFSPIIPKPTFKTVSAVAWSPASHENDEVLLCIY